MSTTYRVWLQRLVALVGALAGTGWALSLPDQWLFAPPTPRSRETTDGAAPSTFYACPMLCTRLDGPGLCPVCGMTLEPFIDTGAVLTLDERRATSIDLRTEPLQRRLLAREVRTLGTFEIDETRQQVVSAWVAGRIEKLYADFTGVAVERGWHLFDLYSPALFAAQKELLVAREALTQAQGEIGRREAERLLTISRERLRLLGLGVEQVAFIETLERPDPVLTIPSPARGVVTERIATAGMYVAQGQPVFRLADLSQLWLIVALHERDLGLVALGQQVSVQVSAYPGKRFVGRVGFIDPVLDKGTRTVRVRVEVANDDSVLKPGMFGIATIYAELGPGLALARPALTGDHACPMHPLERGAAGARCPTCDMEMVPNPHRHGVAAAPLWAVPREAVLSTGKRQLIYIAWWLREADRDAQGRSARRPAPPLTQPDAQGFAVTLGPLAAEYERLSDGTRRKLREYYPLIGGLPTGVRLPDGQLGWHIITRGQFLIDSQMELTAKPSLLRPHGARAGD